MNLTQEQLAALLEQAFVAGFQYSEEGINSEVCSNSQREKMLVEAKSYATHRGKQQTMSAYHYHYYAISAVNSYSTRHMDGIIEADEPILSFEEFAVTKKGIAAKHGVNQERMTICSLTRLG